MPGNELLTGLGQAALSGVGGLVFNKPFYDLNSTRLNLLMRFVIGGRYHDKQCRAV